MSIIDILRTKDITEYIHGLERQPDNTYRKVCEFHSGATNPTSFTVWPKENRGYCFSCGENFDIIKYVMLRDGVTFSMAVETLCDDYGIPLDKDENYQQQKSLSERNESWCRSYEKDLDKVYDYLVQKRGLSDEIIRQFRFGWSAKSSALTIPMFSEHGVLVAFLYRFFDKTPKYKNSQNSILFSKGSYLYNVDKIHKLLRKNKRLYICEGAIDCASAFQQGEAALAYCGISFGKDHVSIIKKLTSHLDGAQIILVPDNDGKANKFVDRGRDLFQKHYPDANVRVAVID